MERRKLPHDLSRVAARLFNAPLLVLPDTAVAIASNLAARLGVAPMRAPDPTARRTGGRPSGRPVASAWSDEGGDGDGDDKPYDVADGVATISVRGELVNRGSWLDSYSGLTSYERLADALRAAAADPAVQAIVLDMDSPGGEAAGAMEAASVVRAVSEAKPVVAFVNSTAASAAYAIAAGAKEIVVTPSAMIGSIGVVWLHMDHSEMMKAAGVKPTLLHAGAFKVDGNPLAPLDPAAAKRIRATIGSYYDLFVDSVAGHRPDLGAEGARATEAGVFVGQGGVEAGLADRVGDLASVVASLKPKPPARPASGAKPPGASAAQLKENTGMAVKLYRPGESHADHLIDQGKVDKTSSWSFSAEDGDALLGDDGDDWDNYAQFHLGEDSEATDKTKARWEYPYGKGGKAYRSGLIAIRQRASQQDEKDIYDAAGRLIEKIDKDEKKEAAMALEVEAARKAGMTEGAAGERARIGAILRAPEAEGRIQTALVFALDADMSPEAAIKALGSVPKAAAAPAPRGMLDAIVPRPDVRPDPGPGPEAASDFERGAAAAAKVLGKKPAA